MVSSKTNLDRRRGKQRFLYRQLADLIRKDIEGGRLKPGEALPSMDNLARQHQLNKATVRQALAELTAAGLVYSVPAQGTFVCDPTAWRQPLSAARSLAIGWISHVSGGTVTGHYHTAMLDALRGALPAIHGHLSVLCTDQWDATAFCKTIGEAHLDGAILAGPFNNEPIKHLLDTRLPAVLIDDTCRGARVDCILVDNRGGGHQAFEHLITLGHRRLACVTGPAGWQISRERLEGALDAARTHGLDPSSVRLFEGDLSPEGGAAAFRDLLKLNPLPTGVFFFNDEMAAGALQALYEHSQLKVPDDISFIGFDDIAWTRLLHPPLTTIRVEKELMIQKAVECLQDILTQKNHLPTTTITSTRLIVRKSTAAPRNP